MVFLTFFFNPIIQKTQTNLLTQETHSDKLNIYEYEKNTEYALTFSKLYIVDYYTIEIRFSELYILRNFLLAIFFGTLILVKKNTENTV